MTLRYIVATLHLITFGIGFYAILTRANALKALRDVSGLERVFKADNLWALAAALWIITGLWRAFGGIEKGSSYYLHSHAFLTKMGLFILVFILEVRPMITLIKWRIKKRTNEEIDFTPAPSLATLSHIQLILLILIVCMAVAMARGMG